MWRRKFRTWLISKFTGPLATIVSVLPPRIAFVAIAAHHATGLPFRNLLRACFIPSATRYTSTNRRLSSSFSRRMPGTAIRVLSRLGLHSEVLEEIDRLDEAGRERRAAALARPHAEALFNLGEFAAARGVLQSLQARAGLFESPDVADLLGQLDLIAGDEDEGALNLQIGAMTMRCRLRPHQNLAAREGEEYRPHWLDVAGGRDSRLFDGYNYIGQRVTHVGEGQLCRDLYAGALAAQKRLRARPIRISDKLARYLQSIDCALDDLRIIPTEWYTQIGHQGMLDILLRMREVGWWQGKVVFLMPERQLVANLPFQRLLDRHGHAAIPGVNIDLDIAAELLSLQRWCGMAFNAFELPDGRVVPWQEAGAKLMVEWEREGRGFPAREEFDRIYGADAILLADYAAFRNKRGMKPDDWFVCLHMRDATHYNEFAGSGQTHRNADAEEYLKAIHHITSLGGWVIKLGGPRSPKLPRMQNLIDYARSSFKSHLMDIQLIRNARLFIGTTSGLTNIAVSMGVRCALVNCITTDAQLWGDRIRFTLKGAKLRDGSFVTQQQLTSTPWRWRMFDANVLARHGATSVNNTSDEIVETVKEVIALADGRPETYSATGQEHSELISRWRSCLSMPHYYGNALPSLYYLKKHPSFLLQSHSPSRQPAMPPRTKLEATFVAEPACRVR
jgi:putative glycosyltransferase (TIGR04372 family)